ncbi:MAG: hypothetical protein ONB05_10705, partial [candidate division KSB1 bacterium]|nr:hypothetical protein [candidate division KSB1 bacterium]
MPVLVLYFAKAGEAETDFKVRSTVTFLTIVDRQVSIIVDEGITAAHVDRLATLGVDVFEPTLLDSIRKVVDTIPAESVVSRNSLPLPDPHYDEFRRTILDLRKRVGAIEESPITIVCSPGNAEKAMSLVRYLVDSVGVSRDQVEIVFGIEEDKMTAANNPIIEALKAKMADRNNLMRRATYRISLEPKLSADHTIFELEPATSPSQVHSWRLIIENSAGEIIKRFEGNQAPKPMITWDWRDETNQLIEPDTYFYYLQWKESADSDWEPPEGKLIKRPIVVNLDNQKPRFLLTRHNYVLTLPP